MSSTRLLCAGVLALAFLALVPQAVLAQSGIAGVVKDTSGAVLPGVTVEASSPVLIEKSRSAISDGTGRYRIVGLTPGTDRATRELNTAAVAPDAKVVDAPSLDEAIFSFERSAKVADASLVELEAHVKAYPTTIPRIMPTRMKVVNFLPMAPAPMALGRSPRRPAADVRLQMGFPPPDFGKPAGLDLG